MSADAYLAARRKLDYELEQIDSITELMDRVRKLLRTKASKVFFSDLDKVTDPSAQAAQDSVTINAADWKDAGQLTITLIEYRKARKAVEEAWATIPPADRAGLVAPDTLLTYLDQVEDDEDF